MDSEPVLLVEPATIPLPSSPTARIDSQPLNTDSLVSIRLSEPVSIAQPLDDAESASVESDTTIEPTTTSRRRSSFEIMGGANLDTQMSLQEEMEVEREIETDEDEQVEPEHFVEDIAVANRVSFEEHQIKLDDVGDTSIVSRHDSRRSSRSRSSSESDDVDWSELDKEEKQDARDEGSDEVRNHCLTHTPSHLLILHLVVYCIFAGSTGTGEQCSSEEPKSRWTAGSCREETTTSFDSGS